MENINDIRALAIELRDLEERKNQLKQTVMEACQKTIKEWSKLVPLSDFKSCVYYLYARHAHRVGGTDYFTWCPTKQIQAEFKKFVEEQFKSDSRYFYCPGQEIVKGSKYGQMFFQLKRAKANWTTRSSSKVENVTISEDLTLTYKYSETHYNGFGGAGPSTQQTMEIDISTFFVTRYQDSTKAYSNDRMGHHNISTKFIDKLIKPKRNAVRQK